MIIIFGLGNPGKEYEKTFHNVGFNFADEIAKKLNLSFSMKKSVNAEIAEGKISMQEIYSAFNINKKSDKQEKIVLVKPQTYMNLSGQAVLAVMKKYGAQLSDIVVALDDIDLPISKFRIRESGSAGTHNGLRNITSLLGSGDFKRVRIGIDGERKGDLASYVLSKMSDEVYEKISLATSEAIKGLFENC